MTSFSKLFFDFVTRDSRRAPCRVALMISGPHVEESAMLSGLPVPRETETAKALPGVRSFDRDAVGAQLGQLPVRRNSHVEAIRLRMCSAPATCATIGPYPTQIESHSESVPDRLHFSVVLPKPGRRVAGLPVEVIERSGAERRAGIVGLG